MASATQFKINIVANDQATAAVGRIEKRFEKFTAPISNLKKQFTAFEKNTGLDKIATGIGKIGRGAVTAAERLIGITAGLAGIATVGSAAALATLGGSWAKAGFQIDQSSQRIGISAARLQSLRGAAGLSGLDPDAMTGSLHSLGGALQDAASNRNMQLANLMSRLGIHLHRTKEGAVDTADAFMQLSSVLSTVHVAPQTKEMLAQQFGVGDMLTLMTKGPKAIQTLEAQFNQSGAGLTKQNIENMTHLNSSLAGLRYSVDGLGNTLGAKLIPLITPLIDKLSSWLNQNSQKIVDVPMKGVGFAANLPKALATKIGSAVSLKGGKKLEYDWANPFQWIREGAHALDWLNDNGVTRVKTAADYFQGQGWSHAQASGLVANLLKESNLNPRAVGDKGNAYGVGQWHADRQAAFRDWAGHGIRQSTLAEQLAFINYELTRGGERGAGDQLRRARTAAEAGAITSLYYERPRSAMAEASSRASLANAIDQKQGIQPVKVTPAVTQVDVHLHGLPPGTKATVKTSGPAGVKVYAANLGGGNI